MATVNFIRYKEQSAGALKGVAEYVAQEEKTLDASSGLRLVSGQNCSPQFACREFLATRSAWHKHSSVWFYHYTQSFHPDEKVDGPTAHEIAREFAAKAWPDSEVLIATHVDVDHIHSHFVVNAVCYKTGKMLRQGPGTLARLREISDELCQAHGFSVLPPQKPKSNGMTSREYRSAAKGESWKFQTMNVIDRCMRRAASREEFIREMECLGYQVRWEAGRKYITYTHPNGKKVRDRKLHEEKYWKERMEREFIIRQQIIAGGIETAQPAARDAGRGGADRGTARLDGTDTRAGDPPHGGGVGQPVDDPQRAVSADSRGVRLRGGENRQPDPAQNERSVDGGDGGHGGNPSAAGAGAETADGGTGWEEERAAFLHSLPQNQSAAPVSRLALSAAELGGIVGSVVQLGSFLERAQPDITVTRPHSDRKALKREREKKIAAGHKPDDREEYVGPGMTM